MGLITFHLGDLGRAHRYFNKKSNSKWIFPEDKLSIYSHANELSNIWLGGRGGMAVLRLTQLASGTGALT